MEWQQIKFLKHLFRSKRQVYLDHNATTSVSRRVRRTMNRVLKCVYGNPSSLYGAGRKSAAVMEVARQQVADAIHADAHEIYFTGCATESNNAVLKSLSNHFYPKKKKIISLPIEHPSVINTLEFLKTQGIEVDYCPVDRHGRVLPAELEKRIDENTFLVCCMLANNEIGTIQDIATLAEIARRHGVLVHVGLRPGARQDPDRCPWLGDRLRLVFGAQASWAQGRRRLVRQTGQPLRSVRSRRPPGKRHARRYRKPAQYRRLRRCVSGCGQTPGPCATKRNPETSIDSTTQKDQTGLCGQFTGSGLSGEHGQHYVSRCEPGGIDGGV